MASRLGPHRPAGRTTPARAGAAVQEARPGVIDTHAHLDALEDAAGALERARAAGVRRVIAIGSGLASARATREIAEREAGVYVAAGVHPHQAADGEDPRSVISADAVAVGEIGLDFFRDYAPHDEQRRVFAAQLELAAELG
ncbi:MAG: hypothetical protein E6G45_14570, partial [Actinobacteria bacterium]